MLLDSLLIKNFRAFKELRIEKLGRVNLIVGPNSTGKTTLLEAIRLYQERGKVRNLYYLISRLLTSRGELDSNEDLDSDHFRFLLHNYSQKGSAEIGIIVNGKRDSKNLKLGKREFNSWSEDSEIYRYLSRERIRFERRVVSSPRDVSSAVLTKGLFTPSLARMWGDISLDKEKKSHLLGAVHLIDPDIEDVNHSPTRSEGQNVVFMVRKKGVGEPIPLKSLGEGIERLFQLILALANVEKGRALTIDEFENGLHWSVQTNTWRQMFTLAAEWDVQIFATTHSIDCVRNFSKVWEEHPQQGAYFRLGRTNKKDIIVRPYDLKRVGDSLKFKMDPRG